MIGVYLDGRMGNQMFQYAFALTAANQIKATFYLDQLKTNFILPEYFEMPAYKHYYNSIKTKLSYYLNNKEISISGNQAPESFTPSNSILYRGFFQSGLYFESSRELIKKEFTIKKKHKDLFQTKYGSLFKNNKTIVIHIRLTDYLEYGNEQLGGANIALPSSYFVNCLNAITDIDNYQVIIISDDISTAKKWFSNKENYKFENNTEIIDFQLLLNADIAMISNSSFSWWAAYLNAKPNKTIYAPNYWLGFKVKEEYPKGIMSENWNWKDVN